MLINPQLNNKCCSEEQINSLLGKIDRVISNIGNALLNNIRYGLTNEISNTTFQDLLLYRDIIVSKLLGNEELSKISFERIISKVKRIINKN